jgi:hypothetical protein
MYDRRSSPPRGDATPEHSRAIERTADRVAHLQMTSPEDRIGRRPLPPAPLPRMHPLDFDNPPNPPPQIPAAPVVASGVVTRLDGSMTITLPNGQVMEFAAPGGAIAPAPAPLLPALPPLPLLRANVPAAPIQGELGLLSLSIC